MRPSIHLPHATALLLAIAGPIPGQTLPAAPAVPAQAPTQDPRQRARPADAAALFRTFAATTGLEARFEEDKHLALLALPLQSKGRLYFFRPDRTQPGYLARIVESPEPSSVLITPTELRLQNRDGTEVVDLKRSDKVRNFITSLVRVFAGDEATLTKSYTIQFAHAENNATGWKLTLMPRDKPLNQMLKSLTLTGEGEAVVQIEVQEPNGDRTVTRIVAADPARKFDAAEQKRLFGIDAK
ncbi:MAG TPA: outer membrane lipoprotein carrier protein LolA [Planctomycetota bacterium]|nr:outer membrane lipoprotein carrier protein LolA [Planctomycetota bacterium]